MTLWGSIEATCPIFGSESSFEGLYWRLRGAGVVWIRNRQLLFHFYKPCLSLCVSTGLNGSHTYHKACDIAPAASPNWGCADIYVLYGIKNLFYKTVMDLLVFFGLLFCGCLQMNCTISILVYIQGSFLKPVHKWQIGYSQTDSIVKLQKPI